MKKIFYLVYILFINSLLYSQHHTQIAVLPNGNYLKCGGVDLGQGCQIHYSSSTTDSQWVDLGNILSVYRTSHTMNVLSDGRVLVIGGAIQSGTPTNTIDILNFNYNTGAYINTTQPLNNMSVARANHTSTLLTKGVNAGNVLICGGNNDIAGNNVSNTCEIFISSSNQVISGPSLSSYRRNHTANILPSGNILFIGGEVNGTGYNMTTDIYYATSNVISPGVSIPLFARAYHSATTLANGNTIIFGGYNGCTDPTLCPDPFSSDDIETQIKQGQGTQGKLDDIVVLDDKGAILQINNQNTGTFARMPYRISNQTSLLHPSGKVYLIGGRGNIAPSYYDLSITLAQGSNIKFNLPVSTGVGISTGNIVWNADINLSRPVSGRIVSGDLFISPPPPTSPPTPSIASDNLEIYLKKTTSTLDGIMIDPTASEGNRGEIREYLKLDDPGESIGSYAVFKPIEIAAKSASGNFYIRFSGTLIQGNSASINGSTATITFTFNLPAIYIGYDLTSATITIKGGSISDSTATVTLTGGNAYIDPSSPKGPVGRDAITNQGIISLILDFNSLNGTITNSTDTPISSTYTFTNAPIASFDFDISFTMSGADLSGLNFVVGKSTAVIRDVIFSDIALYKSKTNQFEFEDVVKTPDKPPYPIPVFDHSSIISKSNNIMIIGGQNCESDPSNNCKRMPNLILNPADPSMLYNKYDLDWKDLPKLNNQRANHTSTVLTDGSILVCGGTDGKEVFSSCELYDKHFNNWVIVSTMTTPRAYHRATLLPNGTVLISGGQTKLSNTSVSIANSAEIYYPSVKTFVKTSDMNSKRMLHTQTLLPNGNVLVTGGAGEVNGQGIYLNTAEIYITTANLWQPVSNLNTMRSEHSATLLKNGNVFISGGINGNGPLNSTEIFISTKSSFDQGPTMSAIKGHTSNLLKNGNVIITGGTNGLYLNDNIYLYTPSNNTISKLPSYKKSDDYIEILPRTNHKAILLPNNNILLSGGFALTENGAVRNDAQLLTYDWIKSRYFDYSLPFFGNLDKRVNHTMVITTDNYIVAIGGADDTYNYLDSVKQLPMEGFYIDSYSKDSIISRKPLISSVTVSNPDTNLAIRVDRGDWIKLKSDISNLHSITDASGGGAGPQTSDFSKPSIYLKSINEDFIIDLSTMFFSTTTLNPNYEQTLSSITVQIPTSTVNVPYGWYYLYDCVNGMCSDATVIQISTSRPTDCNIINLAAQESASTTSIRWNWYLQSLPSNANGFAVFSISDVFITTVSFSSPATYYQTGLLPNTPSAIKVGCYNIGGFSDPGTYAVAQSTVYTKANPPKDLMVTYASFDTVELQWDGSGNNPDWTPYQVEITTYNPAYASPSDWFPIMSFMNNYKQTNLTIRNLEPNWRYYFRVKAKNGNGVETAYDTENSESSTFNQPVSTITVGNIVGLDGTPLSPRSIKWTWNKSGGATGYEIYEYKVTTNFYTKELEDVSVFLSSTTYNYYTQINLSTNTAYQVKVRSYKQVTQTTQTNGDLIYGPFSVSGEVYTLAALPAPSNNVFTQVTTKSFKVTWDANGNPDYTKYRLDISADPNFGSYTSYDVDTDSTTFPYISQVVSGLKPNYKYYGRVYAINKANKITDTSASLGSKYTLAQSVERVYATDISLSGVTLNWDTGENSPETIYQVRATSVSFESPYISTPLPFGFNFKGNSYLINGLWINTTYYFDVTARNMEGIETASIQTTTPVVTLPGPGNAPPSSIAGVTDPNSDTVISGILIDNRWVSMTIPKGSFNTPQPIAIAKLNDNPCGWTFGGSTITFGIYANDQPYIPAIFVFDYFGSEAINSTNPPDINTNKAKIALARYNPDTGQCLPVKTTIDPGLRKITAELNHFSIYQLIILNPSSDLNNIKVFPNPFYPNRSGQGMITIINLPENSNIKIYTLSGQKIYETRSDSTGTAYWDGKNSKGQMAGSGVYLCYIKSSVGSKTIKVAIER